MWTLVTLVGGFLLKHVTFETVKYVAMRAMIIAVILSIGPVVLLKGLTLIMETLLSYGGTYVEGKELAPVTLQLGGIAAYLGSKFKIAEGFSLYLSLLCVSFVLRMIRVK